MTTADRQHHPMSSRGIHYIEGVRNFVQAVDGGVEICTLIVSKAYLYTSPRGPMWST